MPCRTDMIPCEVCKGEHYWQSECLTNPSKFGEGRLGYDSKTAAELGKKTIAAWLKKADDKRRAFNVEGALCDLLTLLEDKGLLKTSGVPQDILTWWEGHQVREQSKIKKGALAKLSAKERRALGIQ